MLAAVLQRVHEVGSKSGEKAEALARAFTPTRNVPAHRQFVIDGEAVVLGVNGISDFDALHSGKHGAEVQLCAFGSAADGSRRSAEVAAVNAQGEP